MASQMVKSLGLGLCFGKVKTLGFRVWEYFLLGPSGVQGCLNLRSSLACKVPKMMMRKLFWLTRCPEAAPILPVHLISPKMQRKDHVLEGYP